MVSSKRSPGRPRPVARRSPGRPVAPGSVNLGSGFDLVAVRSALSPNLPPSLLISHECKWSHDLEQDRIGMGELVGLAAVHLQMGCE